MNYFTAKDYQDQILASVADYFKACHTQSPSTAFYEMTGVPYQSLKGFAEDMPYFCLRVPTGGGKTWLAASCVDIINKKLLGVTEHSVILWLVPSNQIKEQTLKGFKDREHPLYAALATAGAIEVLSLEEAKSVKASTLNTATTVIVATRQAFQVENEENRKVYENNGALMGHFEHLRPEQWQELQKDGVVINSLANVLYLRRPFIIVDEAHNSRTPLSFETLAKFNPSGIMELTATPDMDKTPSNVLHSVSAVELKTEQMIKLPILLRTEPNWQQCLAYALTCRNDLQVLADKEYLLGSNYLRPIVLIQAEARRTGKDTLDVDRVKQELMTNHAIPEHEIVIATGEEKGLTATDEYPLGIMDKKCPVKFVITQQALAEGWDCSFAYILVSMANVHSSTRVEQLLGRILRQPDAIQRRTPELNQSYSFVVSSNFSDTASALRDSLVKGAGFERKEVGQFVKSILPSQLDLELFKNKKIPPIPVLLTEKPVLTQLPKPLREKITWNNDTQELTITGLLTVEDAEVLKATVVNSESKIIIEQAAENSRLVAVEFFKTPAERGERLRVPQLAVYVQGELQLFDDPQMLDYPWDLSRYEAKPCDSVLSRFTSALKHDAGLIDMDGIKGTVKIAFMANLQRSLELVYQPEHWDTVKLATWLCRNITDESATHASKQAFIMAWLQALLDSFSLVDVNEQKFLVRNLLEEQINDLRQLALNNAYQATLFESNNAAISDNYVFEFPQYYSSTRNYDVGGKYGHYDFEHHFHGKIGDFDSKEEFECACYLDQLAAKNKIKFWLRNLVRKELCSFFLQKADGRFYPDFVCVLPDDSILIVEYKGRNGWNDAEDDRLIGGLWASLSNGRCQFVMVTDKQWRVIDERIERRV
ncbi:MAG: DEAD/DEAH box helicase family protein [Methylococcales bacterium]|nr:DEAD/DEAH box helicase family protein [Methylococcales bacterium]